MEDTSAWCCFVELLLAQGEARKAGRLVEGVARKGALLPGRRRTHEGSCRGLIFQSKLAACTQDSPVQPSFTIQPVDLVGVLSYSITPLGRLTLP